MDCSMPGFPVHCQSWSLLKLMSIELVMPSNHETIISSVNNDNFDSSCPIITSFFSPGLFALARTFRKMLNTISPKWHPYSLKWNTFNIALLSTIFVDVFGVNTLNHIKKVLSQSWLLRVFTWVNIISPVLFLHLWRLSHGLSLFFY